MSDNKRIAKNTVFLYFRMLFVMGVSIFSSRIVLNVLGESDYGLYNVVGGFVAMLAFLNGAASGATSRFLTFYLGKKDYYNYQQSFSAAFYIHVGLAILIVLLAESVGLWFLHNKMVIDPERMEAALWVFHLSVLSCFVTFTQVPYNATIIANEHMGIYAYVGIAEALLKLFVLYMLSVSSFDKLVTYAFLLFLVSIAIAMFYRLYCICHFKECRIVMVKNKRLYKELLKYSGWDTLGSITGIAQTQGINVVLNLFFGTVVNAARGVAYQVDAAVNNFIANFLTALNPQVVKSYAQKDFRRMVNLIFFGGKYSFLMFSCLAVPLIIEAPYVLKLWLVSPPDYSVPFLRLVLLNHFISVTIQMLIIGVHATGDVRRLNMYAGMINILKLPFAYLILKLGYDAIWVFVSIIPMTFFCLLADIYVLRCNIQFPSVKYINHVLVKNTFIIFVPTIMAIYISNMMEEGFVRLITLTMCFVLSLTLFVYLFGLTNKEKQIVCQGIYNLKHKFDKNGISKN